MEGDRQSLAALELENIKRVGEERDDEEDGDDDENDDEQRQISCDLESSIGAELRAPQLEALNVPSSLQLGERDLHSDIDASSHLLSEVPVEYSLGQLESAEFKDQIRGTHQGAFVRVTSQALEAQTENQLQSPGCPTSFDLSTTLVTQTIPFSPSPILPEERLSPVVDSDSMCVSRVDKLNNNNLKTVLPVHTLKSSSADGYNWRKYGQKQVKSPQGSRSYYKCTFSDCYAKKIECCDHSNLVIEIIYRSQHNHDPPRKISCTRESRLALSAAPVVGSNKIRHPIREVDDSEPATCSKEAVQKTSPIPEAKQQNSGSSGEDVEVNVEEEHVDEPEPKRRLKKSSSVNPSSILKLEKKPKFIVHAAADVGISGDSYRWRKYGQKMVKGNPHPRNYYRCTSAGCPVRKHIERAVDDTNAAIVTYTGIHDHDMPVPKKRHGPPSGSLVAATATATASPSMNLQLKKSDTLQGQISATQWSVDKEGELTGETLDPRGKKVMESARTLLSIGFEIKPC